MEFSIAQLLDEEKSDMGMAYEDGPYWGWGKANVSYLTYSTR